MPYCNDGPPANPILGGSLGISLAIIQFGKLGLYSQFFSRLFLGFQVSLFRLCNAQSDKRPILVERTS